MVWGFRVQGFLCVQGLGVRFVEPTHHVLVFSGKSVDKGHKGIACLAKFGELIGASLMLGLFAKLRSRFDTPKYSLP